MSEQQKMDQERAAFEAAYSSIHGSISAGELRDLRRGDDYAESTADRLNYSWRIWQARASLPVGVPDAEPVLIQAVAVTRDDEEEGLRLEWLLEGGIAEMEFAGQVLFAMPEANSLCDEDGSAHVYIAPLASPTVKAEQGTTSDKYRAELYDEVWQKARDMGYGNATDALVALERLNAAPSLPAAGSPVEDVEVVATVLMGGVDYGIGGAELGDIDMQADMPALCRLQQALVTDEHDVNVDLMTVAQHERIVAQLAARDAGEVRVPAELLTILASEGLSETESDRYVDAVMDARALLAQRERGGE